MTAMYRQAEIHFQSSGSGAAVVLLHGFLENSSIWAPYVSKVAEKNQVITINLPGHGKSQCTGYIHSMEEMAEAVNAVFLKLKIVNASFIGHSMGGYVSLAFLEKFPEKVRNLTLLNSTPEADSEERRENRDRAINLVKKNAAAFISMSLSNLLTAENNKKYASEIEKLKSEALKMPVQGIIAALEGMKIRSDRTNLLKSFRNKKNIIAGKNDPVLDFSNLKKIASYCSCSLLELPDGHLAFIENKKELL